MIDATPPTIGHNSQGYLRMIEADPDLVYRNKEALPNAIAEIETSLAQAEIDLITSKGRDDIMSRAANLSRLKVSIENAGLERTEEWRKATKEVNDIKTKVKVNFDALRDKAREPLTKWEEAKERREAQIQRGLDRIDILGSPRLGLLPSDIEELLTDLSNVLLTEEAFGAHLLIAEVKVARARETLTTALERARADERDREELARLRAEAQKRAEEDHRREEEARRDEAERLRKEQEAAIDEQRTKRIAEEAVEAERRRAEKEAADKLAVEQKVKADAERRARDFEHRQKVEDAVINALINVMPGTSGNHSVVASSIYNAIVEGKIPHITINF